MDNIDFLPFMLRHSKHSEPFFNSLLTFDIAPSAGAKRGFRFELKLKLIATASFDSERAGKNSATRRKGLRFANWLLVYNPGV